MRQSMRILKGAANLTANLTGKGVAHIGKKVGRKVMNQVLQPGQVNYPQLNRGMQSGGNFSKIELDKDTGELLEVRYTDPSGNEYIWHHKRVRWIQL